MINYLTFAQSKLLGHLKDKRNCVNRALSLLYTLINDIIYKHVQDRRYCRYKVQRIIGTSGIGRMRRTIVDSHTHV